MSLGGGEWEAVLSKAVEQGLADDGGGACSLFNASAAEQSSRASRAPDSHLEQDMVASMTSELRMRIQTATGRSVRLLRSAPSSSALKAELEEWLLEAGCLEAALEDALSESVKAIMASQNDTARERAEHHACKRAFELHLAQTNLEVKRRAGLPHHNPAVSAGRLSDIVLACCA